MIIKLHKNVSSLNIGLLGTRNGYLAEVLNSKKIKFTLINDIKEINTKLDIVFASGVYTILPKEFLKIPKYGIIGFHETPLPEGRGCAPIQWTVEANRANLTITAFMFTEGLDEGEYVYQYNIGIFKKDTLEVLEEKRIEGIKKCFESLLYEMEHGIIVRRKQTGLGSINKRRTPNDSMLDINVPLVQLWDKIRICDNDKYPPYFIIDGNKVVLKYKIIKDKA
ncbi:MAG: hypothetical protein HQ521_00475 [Bacteroidetes bacterium]|nr:hypothetical protein [Bacteroidota bacterium]